jgi:hypothetical protein
MFIFLFAAIISLKGEVNIASADAPQSFEMGHMLDLETSKERRKT